MLHAAKAKGHRRVRVTLNSLTTRFQNKRNPAVMWHLDFYFCTRSRLNYSVLVSTEVVKHADEDHMMGPNAPEHLQL